MEQVDDGKGPRELGDKIKDLRQNLVEGNHGSMTNVEVLFHYDNMRYVSVGIIYQSLIQLFLCINMKNYNTHYSLSLVFSILSRYRVKQIIPRLLHNLFYSMSIAHSLYTLSTLKMKTFHSIETEITVTTFIT